MILKGLEDLLRVAREDKRVRCSSRVFSWTVDLLVHVDFNDSMAPYICKMHRSRHSCLTVSSQSLYCLGCLRSSTWRSSNLLPEYTRPWSEHVGKQTSQGCFKYTQHCTAYIAATYIRQRTVLVEWRNRVQERSAWFTMIYSAVFYLVYLFVGVVDRCTQTLT